MSDGTIDVYEKLRRETATLLGFDADTLTPSQDVRVSMVAGLRLELDRLQTLQMRGEAVDAKVLVSVGEQLEAALRPAQSQEARRGQNRAKLEALINATLAAGDAAEKTRVQELEARVQQLEAELVQARGGTVSPAATPTAPTAEVVSLKPRTLTPEEAAQRARELSDKIKEPMVRPRLEPWRNYIGTRNIHGILRDW
jgi:hypothetical protein